MSACRHIPAEDSENVPQYDYHNLYVTTELLQKNLKQELLQELIKEQSIIPK